MITVINMRAEMEFYNKTLFISLIGDWMKKDIKKLKQKLYYIINEYGIDNINVDISKTTSLDKLAFYDFLDEYDIKYGGNLELVKK